MNDLNELRRKVLDIALSLRDYSLVSLSGGNVSLRVNDDMFVITPSGMVYEDIVLENIPLVDREGKVLAGDKRPSSDTDAIIYMFKNLENVNAIIHTHQPYATAAGFLADEIPEFLVTLIDAVGAPVPVAPFTPSSNLGMGVMAVKYYNGGKALILKHHGVLTFGETLEEALFSAVYLEEAMKTFCISKSIGAIIPILDPDDIKKEMLGWSSYGQ